MRLPSYFAAAIVPFMCSPVVASARTQRVHLRPEFVEGATLRYRIQTTTSSNEHNVAPVVNPEGASEYKQSTSLVVRIDVLQVRRQAASKDSVKFRATFEQADSDSRTNAYAPSIVALDDAFEKLKGKSFEFSIDGASRLADVQNLTKIAPDRDVAARVLSWVHVLFAPVSLPVRGILVGQKWSDQREMSDLPLTNIFWRDNSEYLRNESCASSSGVKNVPGLAPGSECAVLLTRFTIARRGSSHSDTTPEAYVRNGLRTSGNWTGSGESLDAISLTAGLLVSSTQTATQNMDYQIRSAASGSTIRHVGHTTTQTEITLIPNPDQ
ncbi:MAG TPA: hypothetical protein VFW94_11230 [Candidatus Acidoferrales bacterium]|nr:hypothetical protein [Candidatus Acidoferrales bacterium]